MTASVDQLSFVPFTTEKIYVEEVRIVVDYG